MKKFTLMLAFFFGATYFASAQLIPNFQFGAKAGVNLSSFNLSNNTFDAGNRAGYLGGFWARVGGLGFHFQPELYLTGKNVKIEQSEGGVTAVNNVKFTSIDLPLLVGTKVGAFGFGGRFYTGPLVSFKINDDQSFGNAVGNAVTLTDIKNQNFAWQVGAGVDIRDLSIDLRYEYGLTKQTYNDGASNARVNLFNLTLAYKIFSL
ncbi:PorT family protein [Mucilaginibacter sp. JRF]|uniref:porin family protein n=1 Tax=Mucilaginibacter sp. JRF TaxID=2780088 RepID=UPI001880D9B1|nr:porin family protein [Mucilaginibacter sp. JRF]MBE9583746.1 PorT family protein [Mucilaginibacter sp. JRF]